MSEHEQQVDRDGQTLREVLLARLKWEYGGDDADWIELRSLSRLERDIRMWFADVSPTASSEGSAS